MEAEEFNKLLKSLKSDVKAGDKFYKYICNAAKYCLRRWGINKYYHEDIAQSVMLKVHENMPKFVTNPYRYISRITKNYIIDNKKQFIATAQLNEGIGYELDEEMIFSDDIIYNGLDVIDSRIVHMSVVDRFTSKEIALFVGKSPEAVRQRLCRALKKLKENYKKLSQ